VLRKLLSIVFAVSGFLSFGQAPTATIVVPSGILCTGQSLLFTSLTTNTPTAYSWAVNPSGGATIILGNNNQPSVGITFTNAGMYTVSLTVSNASGTVTASTSVSVGISPISIFNASLTTVGFPNQIDLTNFSTNADGYLWTFSETPTTYTTTNVSHTYSASGAYTVTLVAMNLNGCSTISNYSFRLADSSGITLPNFFTPNADGTNDVFKPIARGLSSLKVSIYNRFGILVYNWDTVNGFWDGYTTSGILCESGTYFCVLEATGFDNKSYKLKSYLNLFRN
jgi:gliding motility-associated-like protein